MSIDTLVIVKGFTAFGIPVLMSSLWYSIANLAARLFASTPRQIYIARLILMAVLLVVWWGFYLPSVAKGFGGNFADPQIGERYASYLAKQAGTTYGLQTVWAWFVVALIDRPRRHVHAARTDDAKRAQIS